MSGIMQMIVAAYSVSSTPNIDLLVAAGGGMGGNRGPGSNRAGAGGGAGGLCLQTARPVVAGVTYTIIVGVGGSSPTRQAYMDSTFDTVIAIGGGVGRIGSALPVTAESGGSGGGAGGGGLGGPALQLGSGGALGYGFAGGGSDPLGDLSAGGGGAGGVGTYATGGTATSSHAGGPGVISSISGRAVTYCSGGAGNTSIDSSPFPPADGYGHGGVGGKLVPTTAVGKAGSMGVVIISYSDAYALPASVSGGSLYELIGGRHVYTFISSGSITF